MSKHTPGKWKIQDNTVVSPYSQLRIDSDSDGAVAIITNGGTPSDTDYANARLIAAAPEMLEALKVITTLDPLSFVPKKVRVPLQGEFDAETVINNIYRLIAKVEREAL